MEMHWRFTDVHGHAHMVLISSVESIGPYDALGMLGTKGIDGARTVVRYHGTVAHCAEEPAVVQALYYAAWKRGHVRDFSLTPEIEPEEEKAADAGE